MFLSLALLRCVRYVTSKKCPRIWLYLIFFLCIMMQESWLNFMTLKSIYDPIGNACI